MLGGYGITYEVNIAAFNAIRGANVFIAPERQSEDYLSALLRQPLPIGKQGTRYRYPNQKAARIAEALSRLHNEPRPNTPLDVRLWLKSFAGIGPKTASWIVRNYFGSSDVAIIDIHIQRAAVTAGIFDPSWSVSRHYDQMESAFIAWARTGDVPAADLDAVIWVEQAARARTQARRVRRRDVPGSEVSLFELEESVAK
ncbi:8-oxoguanine DNA glycosylase [Clavibacter michiganensis]|uniref:8-oxoguanine DNA glycosylase n=1 Tax=Clavibacter michiganensis TaxID=28447 RepID=UPI0026DAFAD5|nr:hypothetical protein [Clavibacter michiganensis]MDO4027417.1 hypothetical protein [Clavibacter michiganensis]MDO4065468.1 hypothetical protein [Clavibacter michiganensis]MDO4070769.1 hypothetical protein [Clavibacter michiganensis]MDO4089189.1 hypothetical protein [Clavibacter michiganensis]